MQGVYLSADGEGHGNTAVNYAGRDGLRIGDGYHDYVLATFVSCRTTALPPGARVTAAVLSLRTSRVYGKNPFTASGCCGAGLQVDMVRSRCSWQRVCAAVRVAGQAGQAGRQQACPRRVAAIPP